ncbi:ABC transporter substrate-binding protein [Gilliamella sp. wkB178]|uniref:ABC transporter substrate-binding protein n=1 Tax=Gilliamella sp. wkB178 TaxID=3120259 RepID=UPI000A5D6AAB|nr:ABC transporter substrate-binding protein [Gilliamella apicola]
MVNRYYSKVIIIVAILFFSIFSVTANPNDQSEIVQKFGDIPPPNEINRVLSSGPVADVLLLSVAPNKLVGLSSLSLSPQQKKFFSPAIQNLTMTGRLAGRGTTASYEKIIQLTPNLIVDIGNITPTYVDLAKQVEKQTRIPYLLINGKLSSSPQQIRQLSHILNNDEQGSALAQYAEKVLKQTKDIGNLTSNNQAIKVYSARGPDGLETGLRGSIHTEVLDWIGAKNVAEQAGQNIITRVSIEQLMLWQPDVIIISDRNFYAKVSKDPLWQRINAVKEGRVYLAPSLPFGWIDGPPSINRLMGLSWLSHILYPQNMSKEQFTANIVEYFKLFYNYQLSTDELKQILTPEPL